MMGWNHCHLFVINTFAFGLNYLNFAEDSFIFLEHKHRSFQSSNLIAFCVVLLKVISTGNNYTTIYYVQAPDMWVPVRYYIHDQYIFYMIHFIFNSHGSARSQPIGCLSIIVTAIFNVFSRHHGDVFCSTNAPNHCPIKVLSMDGVLGSALRTRAFSSSLTAIQRPPSSSLGTKMPRSPTGRRKVWPEPLFQKT